MWGGTYPRPISPAFLLLPSMTLEKWLVTSPCLLLFAKTGAGRKWNCWEGGSPQQESGNSDTGANCDY